jgi:hypothetical protein
VTKHLKMWIASNCMLILFMLNFEAGTANSKAEEKKMEVIVINPSIPSRGRLLQLYYLIIRFPFRFRNTCLIC